MRRLFWFGTATLILNSASVMASLSPSLWFYANVGAHVVLGIGLSIALLAWLLLRGGVRATPIGGPRR